MSVCYLFEDENGINGLMCGRLTTYLFGKEYFIDEFCIFPDCQRKGIGSNMLQYVREDLKQYGIVSLVLNTEKGFPSEKFYKKNGFVQKENLIFMYNDFV